MRTVCEHLSRSIGQNSHHATDRPSVRQWHWTVLDGELVNLQHPTLCLVVVGCQPPCSRKISQPVTTGLSPLMPLPHISLSLVGQLDLDGLSKVSISALLWEDDLSATFPPCPLQSSLPLVGPNSLDFLAPARQHHALHPHYPCSSPNPLPWVHPPRLILLPPPFLRHI
ncbi:hypothetical protein BC826DRAFT_480490 [Russula brevipes]|nr:hypothetical protein BC826DRAFT_480490 [Russula brevipes]